MPGADPYWNDIGHSVDEDAPLIVEEPIYKLFGGSFLPFSLSFSSSVVQPFLFQCLSEQRTVWPLLVLDHSVDTDIDVGLLSFVLLFNGVRIRPDVNTCV